MAVPSMTLLHVGLLVVVLLAGVKGEEEEEVEEEEKEEEKAPPLTNVWAKLGTSIIVPCPLRIRSCPGIKWKKIDESGASIKMDQPPRKFSTNDCGLVINNVSQADAVYYQCTISGQSEGVYLFLVPSSFPSCSTDPPDLSKDVAEHDPIHYICNGTIYGIAKPRVTWSKKDGKLAEGKQDDNSTGNYIYRTLSTRAKAPKLKKVQCYASFNSKLGDVSLEICETKEFKILYSVRKVFTWPLFFVDPGEELTCYADANPNATFSWLVKEEGASNWKTLSHGKTVVAELKNGTSSAQYKCVAKNLIRGKWHEKESRVTGKKEAVADVPYAWAYLGNTVTVRCPLPYSSCIGIAWHWFSESAGPVVIPSQSSGKYDFTNNCGLVIKDVRQVDAVFYQCTISGQSEGVFLFVLPSVPSCSTIPPDTSEDVAEDDDIQYVCSGTIYGIGKPQVTWVDKKGKTVEGLQDDNPNDYHIRGSLSTRAKAPEVKTMECYASFHSKGNVVSVKVCETKEFKILYSVRKVITWPLFFADPGEELTCYADGNPNATFSWLVKEEGASNWTTLSYGETVVAELKNGTSSAQYKCVAVNYVKGKRHEAESPEITVTKHGKLIRIAIIVTICVVVLVAAVVGVIVYKKLTKKWPNPLRLFKSD